MWSIYGGLYTSWLCESTIENEASNVGVPFYILKDSVAFLLCFGSNDAGHMV